MLEKFINGSEQTVKIIPVWQRCAAGFLGPGAALTPVMLTKASVVQEKVQPVEALLDSANIGLWFIWALAFFITSCTAEDSIIKSALTSIGLPGFLIAWFGYGFQVLGN